MADSSSQQHATNLISLFAEIDVNRLQKAFPRTGVSRRQFVRLIQSLLSSSSSNKNNNNNNNNNNNDNRRFDDLFEGARGSITEVSSQPSWSNPSSRAASPFIPGSTALVATSPSRMDESTLRKIIDIYNQIDARGENIVKWNDFSSYVMSMDVMEDAMNSNSIFTSTKYHYTNLQVSSRC